MKNFCCRAYGINPASDVIMVFGGTNDYGHGNAPFGTMEDVTPNTFCGAVEFLMTFLLENFAGKRIVFLTPARRLGDTEPPMMKENSVNVKQKKKKICIRRTSSH